MSPPLLHITQSLSTAPRHFNGVKRCLPFRRHDRRCMCARARLFSCTNVQNRLGKQHHHAVSCTAKWTKEINSKYLGQTLKYANTTSVCVHAWMYSFSQFVAALLLSQFFFLLSPMQFGIHFHILFFSFIFCVIVLPFSFAAQQKNASDIRRTISRLFRCFPPNLCFECSWKARANSMHRF